MFNKLIQTVLSRRSPSALKYIRNTKPINLCQRLNSCNHRLMITSNFTCYTQIKCSKYKSSSKTSKNTDDPEDSDEEEDDSKYEELEETGKKIKTINTNSMRLDAVVKACFGISRNKAETAFYESKIRKNGVKTKKKSELVYEGDEIDLVHSVSPNNPDMLVVSRVLILKLSDNNNMYRIKLARDKNITISTKVENEE